LEKEAQGNAREKRRWLAGGGEQEQNENLHILSG